MRIEIKYEPDDEIDPAAAYLLADEIKASDQFGPYDTVTVRPVLMVGPSAAQGTFCPEHRQRKGSAMSTDLDRAETLLTEALGEIRSHDVIPTVTQALAALYRSVGESPKTVIVDAAGYLDGDMNAECSCPRELVGRGGWQSQCPVHGT